MSGVLTHYSVDFHEGADWWEARCNCGVNLGVFPDAETACDALMQHAYEQGVLDVLDVQPVAEEAGKPLRETES